MPSVQYSWSSTDTSVVTVDEVGRATGLGFGRARVVVQVLPLQSHDWSGPSFIFILTL